MSILNNPLLMLTIISFVISLWYVVTAQEVPSSPCPDVFQYNQKSNGDIYGRISFPYDGKTTLNLGINASMKGYYTDKSKVNLKISMDTPEQDLIEQRAKTLSYSVSFPFQHTIPKITSIELNNQIYCSGPPEQLIAGSPGVSSLWSGHKFYFQTANRIAKPQDLGSTDSVKDTGHPVTANERFPDIFKPNYSSHNENQGCGVTENVISPLILGGTEIFDGTYPWLAAMFVSKGTAYEYKCNGNLVSKKHIITAARCVSYYKTIIIQTEDILFVFGTSNLRNWAANGAVTRGASKFQTHPEFNQDSGHGDISIITLDRPLQFSTTIAPICLWSGNNDLGDIVKKTGIVAGWGTDKKRSKPGQYNVLVARSIEIPVVPENDCLVSNFDNYLSTSSMTFCAGRKDGKGTCIGDTGAGFMIYRQGRYYLRGLVSKLITNKEGDECDTSQFMIFCDVAKFTPWIETSMK